MQEEVRSQKAESRMRKAEGRNLESKYDEAITGGPAPARSVTVRRSGPRAGNGSRTTPEGVRDGPGMPVLQRGAFVYHGVDPDGTVASGAQEGEAREKKSV